MNGSRTLASSRRVPSTGTRRRVAPSTARRWLAAGLACALLVLGLDLHALADHPAHHAAEELGTLSCHPDLGIHLEAASFGDHQDCLACFLRSNQKSFDLDDRPVVGPSADASDPPTRGAAAPEVAGVDGVGARAPPSLS